LHLRRSRDRMKIVTFLGDVFLPRPYSVRVEFPGEYVFNLEYPITAASNGWPGKVNLRAGESYIAQTFSRSPIAVCLANNHIMDFGPQGLADTRTTLSGLGIATFGAGALDENAGNPLILERSGLALLGYACSSTAAVLATGDHPGAAALDLDRIAVDIAEARKAGARRVVVSLHWGEEEVSLPRPRDVGTARRILAAGADLIVGHHSHCIQRFERHDGRFVFYGLGNCIMPDIDAPSYFEQTGGSTRRFVKKQQWWNKRSLAVDYDIDSQAVSVRELRFDGTSLRAGRPVTDRSGLRIPGDEQYAASYRRAFSFGKMRHKVMSLVSARRTPRPRHLKSLLAIAREVTSPRY
jgi:hypothetical protein